MESQIQQMKSSIANIQNHLRKLECQQTIKMNEQESNILPESILEEVYDKPKPTPKVTQIVPNIIHTDFYTPNRHHLDDTQMKKALRDQGMPKSRSRRSSKKQKSLTVKTKYIYDGSRVVYIPPLVENQSDYGHIVVQSEKKPNHDTYQRNYEAYTEYGGKKKPKGERKRREQKRNIIKERGIKMERGVGHQKSDVNESERKRMKSTQIKRIKSTKIQCNLMQRRVARIKEPFQIKWSADTDSDFSELQL